MREETAIVVQGIGITVFCYLILHRGNLMLQNTNNIKGIQVDPINKKSPDGEAELYFIDLRLVLALSSSSA